MKIIENGIRCLKLSSKVSEFDIQYKLEIKYPKPNIQPILKDSHFPLEYFDRKNKNKIGNVIKFMKKKL